MKEAVVGNLAICECADLSALVPLAKLCGLDNRPNIPEDDLARILANHYGKIWVATSGKTPIGLIAANSDGRRGWLYYLGVVPSMRNQGVGQLLLEKAQLYLKDLGLPKFLLLVREEDKRLLNYYEKFGFKEQSVLILGKDA